MDRGVRRINISIEMPGPKKGTENQNAAQQHCDVGYDLELEIQGMKQQGLAADVSLHGKDHSQP